MVTFNDFWGYHLGAELGYDGNLTSGTWPPHDVAGWNISYKYGGFEKGKWSRNAKDFSMEFLTWALLLRGSSYESLPKNPSTKHRIVLELPMFCVRCIVSIYSELVSLCEVH